MKQVLDNAYLICENIFNEDQFCHSRPLLVELKALNVYQINLYQYLNFAHNQ